MRSTRRSAALAALILTISLTPSGVSWAQGFGGRPSLTLEILERSLSTACVETGGSLMKMAGMARLAKLPEADGGEGALAAWKLPSLLTIAAMDDGSCRLIINDHAVGWLDGMMSRSNANVLIAETRDNDIRIKRFAFRSPALPDDDNIRVMEIRHSSDEISETLSLSFPGPAAQNRFRTAGQMETTRARLDLKAAFGVDEASKAFTRYCLETGGHMGPVGERVVADGGVEKPREPGSSEAEWVLEDRADIGVSGKNCALVAINEQPALKSHDFGPGVQSLTTSVMGDPEQPERIVYATLTPTQDEPEGRLAPVMVTNSPSGLQFLALPDSGPALVKGWSQDEMRRQLQSISDGVVRPSRGK
jgi:hypothetical protein